jgi:cyclic pyranopterin phosphate synthase
MDKYCIDSHKLMLHPHRVSKWLEGEKIYPIYMEISPSGKCNQRCTFCSLDYMGYKDRFLDEDRMYSLLSELSIVGVKSIMYAGEGEPLLHPQMVDIIQATKDNGIDVALTTNGTLLDHKVAEKIIPYLSWVKVSINAATDKTYKKIHRGKDTDLRRVLGNLVYAVTTRNIHNYSCTIGTQVILLPDNVTEIRS